MVGHYNPMTAWCMQRGEKHVVYGEQCAWLAVDYINWLSWHFNADMQQSRL
jgi:hypothetical protein